MNKINNVKILLKKIIKDLENLKAIDIQSLDIKNRSALADFIVVASGNSSRHVNSIVTNLIKKNKKKSYLQRVWVKRIGLLLILEI